MRPFKILRRKFVSSKFYTRMTICRPLAGLIVLDVDVILTHVNMAEWRIVELVGAKC